MITVGLDLHKRYITACALDEAGAVLAEQLPGVGSNNALYVSLKPGIDWDWRRGSFVPDSLFRIRR